MRIHLAWAWSPMLLLFAMSACSSAEPSPARLAHGGPGDEGHVHPQSDPTPTPAAASPDGVDPPTPAAGETAPFQIEGDVVHVNNSLCAASRSPMAPEALGQFVSRVEYVGQDPRFQGRTFEFNQCCGGCVARFPSLWAENADEILAFHGVSPAQAPL